jgi:transcriptional regulator with XRE-family HTH domain
MTTANRHRQLWDSLRDPEFRKQFIDEFINVGIASQIHGIREKQNLTQARLAERLGAKQKQPSVSSWENPSYGNYTLKTLKDLAKAFDVGLLVRFVPFSTIVDWTLGVTGEVLAPPSFGEEDGALVPPRTPGVIVNAAGVLTDGRATAEAADKFVRGKNEPSIDNRGPEVPILENKGVLQNATA